MILKADEQISAAERIAQEYANPEGVDRAWKNAIQYCKPPPKQTPAEWAEENIQISLGNALPGPIRFGNAPYQIEPLNAMADPTVERITLMWGAQTGKTEVLNCAQGYYICHNPSSQLMMQPSQGDLHTWLETKFNPMVEANATLKDRIAKPRGREGVNNQQMKSYPGGFLMFAWSGSPRTMRGRSAPIIYCDEVDGYEYTAEGHPVSLLWQRAATFGDQRKLLLTSTPTIKGSSFVESSFEDGDQRRYHIPCPHCHQFITLQWSNVVWDKDIDGNALPSTAIYACQECGSTISDSEKRAALKQGHWVAARPFDGHASYHLNELYSSFRRWRDIVRSFLEKKATNDLQTFVNVSLAETWEEKGERIDPHGLLERVEPMVDLPADVLMLIAGVDIQDDRLEMSLYGVSLIDGAEVLTSYRHLTIVGDPSSPVVWQALESHLFATYQREDGVQMMIRATAVDSGHFTQQVYAFVKKHTGRRVFAVKGVGGEGRPIAGRPSKNNIGKCPLYAIGVDTVKDLLFARLKMEGAIRFSDTLDEEYFNQLTAEKIVTRFQKGFKRRVYEKTRPRNEALDCAVYAYAAYIILGVNLKTLSAKQLHSTEEKQPEPEPTYQPLKPARKRASRRGRQRNRVTDI